MKRVFFILFLCCSAYTYGQSPHGVHTALRLTSSSSSFLCDLGGKDANGTNDLSDLNLEQTRYAFGFGLQQYIGNFSFGANGFYVRLSADDLVTNAKSRRRRRLHAITDVAELSFNIEYEIPRTVPVLKHFYANLGAGIMIFQPMARYNGELHKLRPLGTEGQNYLPGRKQYSHFSPVIPFGFGYKFHFHNGSCLAIDFNLRKSFTDYLDDVSTTYADPEIIGAMSGDVAQYLADPSIEGYSVGDRRGDSKDNDQYFLIGFRYELPITLSRSFKLNNHCSFQRKTYHGGELPKYSKRRHKKPLRIFR